MSLGRMWFGTEEKMQWIPAPLPAAQMSPQGWSAGGTLLGGGGYQFTSFGSHRTYQFGWPKASAREAALIMQSYAGGDWGRGLIHFQNPNMYDQNVLPAQWASPARAIDGEAPSLVYGVRPTAASTPSHATKRLPIRSAVYNLSSVTVGYRGAWDSLFIPVPQGHRLLLGAVYTATGSGGVFSAPVNSSGSIGTPERLEQVSPTANVLTPNVPTLGGRGVRLWVGRSETGTSSVTLSALMGKIVDSVSLTQTGYGSGLYGSGGFGGSGLAIVDGKPWIAGSGHSGCRFDGWPTEIHHSGTNGGQVEYAASFRETGSWEA